MNQILKAMQKLMETIDQVVSVSLSEEQRVWAMFWRRSLTHAITKAIKSGWIKEGEL
jgi:hypothetical protein